MKLFAFVCLVGLFGQLNGQLSRRCQRLELGANDSDKRDVCVNQFSLFLSCFTGKIESEIDDLLQEGDSQAQAQATQCFQRYGCGIANFDEKSALDTFLPCAETDSRLRSRNCVWRVAVDSILDLLSDVPKPVSTCMLTYFKGIGGRKIEQCTRDFPPQPNQPFEPPFTMPPIPGYEQFEISDMKRMLLYRLMTRHHLLQCASSDCGTHPDQAQPLIDCLVGDAQPKQTGICLERESCENTMLNGFCLQRYGQVHKSVCQCAKAQLDQGLLAAFENWGELKSGLIQGVFECQFEKCYIDNDLQALWGKRNDGGMYDKLRAVKQSVIKAVVRLTTGRENLPSSMKHALVVVKSLIDEFSSRWSGTLCSECEHQVKSPSEVARANYEHMVANHDCDAEIEIGGLDDLGSLIGGGAGRGNSGNSNRNSNSNSDLSAFFQG